ncbi:unnamed protein product [Owenia fusiformis]|uniref:Uridylate-specific endoribonuclease n=1 Tax=Owenia fusiformis TaxID=6347 RepID=A0A8S4N412_OWEFU|nr:unnamed protein product [Owenia fusiformis]
MQLLIVAGVLALATVAYGQSNVELHALTESLWSSDVNRASNNDVQFSTGGSTLYTYVNPSVLSRPTFAAFRALLDNYIPEIGIEEPPCAQCRQEEDAFINAILDTDVMQQAWDFLVTHGFASSDRNSFVQQLKDTWFLKYSRSQGRAMDSSGFEHVFVGEIRNGGITGFHSWVQYYQEEQAGETELFGEIERCNPHPILTVSHSWLGAFKEIGGWYMRASPEFEIAVFTVCFNARRNVGCNIMLDGYPSIDMGKLKDIPIFWLKKTVTKVMVNDFNKNGVWDAEDCKTAAEKIIKIGNLTGAKAEEVLTFYCENMPSYFQTATNITQWIIDDNNYRNDPNSPPTVDEWGEKWFGVLDLDGDGIIDMAEYKVFWDAYGLDPDYLKPQFDFIDTDGNGKISCQEFVKASSDYFYDTDENANMFWGPIKDFKMI